MVDLIRGKSVEEALGILEFTPKRGARIVAKTLVGGRQRRARAARRRRRALREARVGRRGPDREALHCRARRAAPPVFKRTQPHHGRRRRAPAAARRPERGTENPSEGLPPRDHRDLGLALVRAAGVRGAAARGHQDPQLPEEAPVPRGRLEDRHRARREQGEDQHPHRAPGHRHRQEGRGDREAQAGAGASSRARRCSSTSTRCAGPTSTRSSSPRTSPSSSSAASRSGAP